MMKAAFLLTALACVAWGQIVMVPPSVFGNAGTGCSDAAMNNAATRAGVTFTTTDTAITGVIFRIGSVTAGGSVAVRLYNVDGSGLPTGTPVDLATTTIGDANRLYKVTWNSQPITPGVLYALMLEFPSYDNQNFNVQSCAQQDAMHRPFSSIYFNGSSWQFTPLVAFWILGSDGHVLPETAFLLERRTDYEISPTGNPRERGIACSFSYPLRVFAIKYFGTNMRTGPAAVDVYRNGSLIASYSAPPTLATYFDVVVPANFVIEPGQEYIISVRPTGSTATGFFYWDMNAIQWTGLPAEHKDTRKLFGQSSCQAIYKTSTNQWVYAPWIYHPISIFAVPWGM